MTYLSAGTSDSLFGQSEQMAAALRRAGVEHEFHPLDGAPHGFMQLPFHWSYLAGQITVHEFLRKHASMVAGTRLSSPALPGGLPLADLESHGAVPVSGPSPSG